jgi:hypothetical protein
MKHGEVSYFPIDNSAAEYQKFLDFQQYQARAQVQTELAQVQTDKENPA